MLPASCVKRAIQDPNTEPTINQPWPNYCAAFHWSYLIAPYMEQDNGQAGHVRPAAGPVGLAVGPVPAAATDQD